MTITRDAYDVPDVHGATDGDAWFGAGYAIAQDRLVQLELFRRGTKGTLAEVLGKSRLASDIEARRDYYTDAELRKMLKRVPSQLRARFSAYADGINAYAAKVAANPALEPKEFTLLKLKFAKWTALDSVRIGIQLARTIPSSDGAELDNWTALRKLGAKRFDRAAARPPQGRADHGPRRERPLPVDARPHGARTSARASRTRAPSSSTSSRRRRPRARRASARRPASCPRTAARTPGPSAAPATRATSSTARSSASRSRTRSSSSRSTGPASTCAASPRPACR